MDKKGMMLGIMFPFLIGKVLTSSRSSQNGTDLKVFPFLIGKVLTEIDFQLNKLYRKVSIPYR